MRTEIFTTRVILALICLAIVIALHIWGLPQYKGQHDWEYQHELYYR